MKKRLKPAAKNRRTKPRMTNYTPTPDELKKHASLFWPKELLDREGLASIIPGLVGTQDKFISILDIADKSPDAWKHVLTASSGLKANVFLKHLMVLADVGGEMLMRLRPEFAKIFPDKSMAFEWQGKTHRYQFKEIIGKRSLGNKALFVDGPAIAQGHELTSSMEDVTMLLLFGAAVVNAPLPQMIGEKCMIGSLIGKKAELQRFVKQRYIFVSRITGGATSNALGQIAQDHVRDLLCEFLPKWKITRNGTIAGISQNAGTTDMNFDVVAQSPSNKFFAIEVSYQVTTNSVIERKSGQAQPRAELLHKAGHKIAYVLDGAGNFERDAALRTICQFSDCTVAFTREQIKRLSEFLAGAS